MRIVTGGIIVLIALLAGVYSLWRDGGGGGGTIQAPYFEVDPLWPKPLPNHWILGSTIGVSVDADDHVWIVHDRATLEDNERGLEFNPPRGECCAAAPPVLEFDAAGNLQRHWGGPGSGYQWPTRNHGLTIDHQGNVWIGGNGPADGQVLKFTRDGKFLLQVGRPIPEERRGPPNAQGQPTYAANSHDTMGYGRVAKIFVDPRDNEAYLADGYGNRRVAVIDAESGALKRYWGAYGNRPDDADLGPYKPDAPPAQQFRSPVHCADMSNDRLVYVCDRVNNRIQVFNADGTFVKEGFIIRSTLGSGSAWDIAFSKDPAQTYLFVSDGINMRVHVLRRDTLEMLTSFGDGGRQPGQFYGVHSIATDSQGNVYTTETWQSKRVQKFVYKGMRDVPRLQGVVWPQ
jgi:DNA-binding beta-propeller fold protein YncE